MEPSKQDYVGTFATAADGGSYGIYIVGYLPKVDDFVVMETIFGEINYGAEPYRLDADKASYRYVLVAP